MTNSRLDEPLTVLSLAAAHDRTAADTESPVPAGALETTPLRRWLAPSIVDLVFVFFALAIPFALAGRLLNGDGDAARHLRLGEHMLERGALLQTYPFSFNREGDPFLAFEWGSEIAYALALRAEAQDEIADSILLVPLVWMLNGTLVHEPGPRVDPT